MTAAATATAVLAAAGAGERLRADTPKAFVALAGRPMAAWSMAALADAARVGPMVAAAPPGREAELEALAPAGARLEVVSGGDTRAASVAAALERVATDLVAIHDAARPLVTPDLVDALIARLSERDDADGVIAASPIFDTVKRAKPPSSGGVAGRNELAEVERTESREALWAAQTPQVFRVESLRAALAQARQDAPAATDEAMVVEKSGGKVLIHAAPAWNLKVTTPDDLRIAALFLGD